MAILRAGPFASSSDSFLDEPTTATTSVIPVNCSMNDWVNDDWKFYLLKLTTDAFGIPNVVIEQDYKNGAAVSESYTGPAANRALANIQVRFAYQATEDTTIHIKAKAIGLPSFFAGRDKVYVLIGDDFTGEESSGAAYQTVEIDQDFTLPATVVPTRVIISASADGEFSGGTSRSATSSIDITIPTP